MDSGLLLICGLTFIIHLIGTLANSVRIAGARTQRIALALSLFNVLMLVSRTSNSFQAPLLAKRVEQNIAIGIADGLADFRWLLGAASLATLVGALLIPTFQRLLSRWVALLGERPSLLSLFRRLASPAAVAHVRESTVLPRWTNVTALGRSPLPWGVAIANTVAMAIWSVGVFAALYAGYLRPELRVTASQLSAVVNGVATILMFMFLDPYISLMTDDVATGRLAESAFRRMVVVLTGTRFVGTVLAQVILVPSALWIVAVAEWL